MLFYDSSVFKSESKMPSFGETLSRVIWWWLIFHDSWFLWVVMTSAVLIVMTSSSDSFHSKMIHGIKKSLLPFSRFGSIGSMSLSEVMTSSKVTQNHFEWLLMTSFDHICTQLWHPLFLPLPSVHTLWLIHYYCYFSMSHYKWLIMT